MNEPNRRKVLSAVSGAVVFGSTASPAEAASKEKKSAEHVDPKPAPYDLAVINSREEKITISVDISRITPSEENPVVFSETYTLEGWNSEKSDPNYRAEEESVNMGAVGEYEITVVAGDMESTIDFGVPPSNSVPAGRIPNNISIVVKLKQKSFDISKMTI